MRVTSAVFGAVMLITVHGEARGQQVSAAVGCYEFDRAYFRWPDFAVQGAPPPSRVLRLLPSSHS